MDTWLRFPVGTGYAYSNDGIDLAGYILERTLAKPFPVVMRDSLLGPLGMDARFQRFQLSDGTIDGRTVLAAALMQQMRTVPAPNAGAPAGYALGVARTRWRAGQGLDLFSHGGGGYGFLSDLLWLPQLQLGIAVLTNSSSHDLQNTLAQGILGDLVTWPDSE